MKRKKDGTIDRRTTDGRANSLARGGFIPARLVADSVTIPVAAKLTPALIKALDDARGAESRSSFIRRLVERDAEIRALVAQGAGTLADVDA